MCYVTVKLYRFELRKLSYETEKYENRLFRSSFMLRCFSVKFVNFQAQLIKQMMNISGKVVRADVQE